MNVDFGVITSTKEQEITHELVLVPVPQIYSRKASRLDDDPSCTKMMEHMVKIQMKGTHPWRL